ncbi:MAG: diguanylate cyclase [Gammaproteobacteria bacterium]|nr:diguanylate cyclase [Gammaproteobacteria bacterium]
MKPDMLPVTGIALSVIFWVVDSSLDVLLFGADKSILENIISPGGVELWMRSLVVCLLMIFSLYTRQMLQRQMKVSAELEKYKKELEEIVDSRTEELRYKNQLLENEIVVRKNTEETLELISSTDPLTNLYNRRKFSEILKSKFDCRSNLELSLMLCDIDKFKRINDGYGHNTGDQVLIAFSKLISDSVRKTDVVARWGGEEFVFLLPDTSLELAFTIAEKLRNKIAEYPFSQVGEVTASFGVATFMPEDHEEDLFGRADSALYIAKEMGRNQVSTG